MTDDLKPRYSGIPNLGIDSRATTEINKRAWLNAKNMRFLPEKIVKRPGCQIKVYHFYCDWYCFDEIKDSNGNYLLVGVHLTNVGGSLGNVLVYYMEPDDADATHDQTFNSYPCSEENYFKGAFYSNGDYYFSSGQGRLLKYVPKTSIALAATDAPAAKYVHSFAERIIVGRTREGDDIGDYRPEDYYPWRLRWCVNGDPSDWTGTGSGAVDLKDSPGIITGISSMHDHLIVYKEDAIIHGYRTGEAAAPFRFVTRYEGIGVKYPHTLKTTGEYDFFVGKDDIYMYDGFRYTPITTDQQTGRSIREEIFYDFFYWKNKNPIYAFVAKEWGEYWILTGIAEGKTLDTEGPIWIYNYINRTWAKYNLSSEWIALTGTVRHKSDGQVAIMLALQDMGDGENNAIFEILPHYKKDGADTNIDMELESGDYMSQVDPGNQIELAALNVIYESAEPAPTLNISTSIDRDACWGPIDTLELHSGGVPNIKRLDLRNLNRPTVGQTVRYKITETSQSMLSILDLWPEFIERGPALGEQS